MGPFNSVSDGVVNLYIFYGLMAYFGNDFFAFVLIPSYGIRLNDIINFLISLSQVYALITK
jgi:hypothetical protein